MEQCPAHQEILKDVFRNIEDRNNNLLKEVLEQQKTFNNKMIDFIKSREKIDKLEAGCHLMFNSKQIKHIQELTLSTKENLVNRAMNISKGSEERAMTLLFDPSFDISF